MKRGKRKRAQPAKPTIQTLKPHQSLVPRPPATSPELKTPSSESPAQVQVQLPPLPASRCRRVKSVRAPYQRPHLHYHYFSPTSAFPSKVAFRHHQSPIPTKTKPARKPVSGFDRVPAPHRKHLDGRPPIGRIQERRGSGVD